VKQFFFIKTSATKGMRHLHAGKINYNATSMINEDMMMMIV